MLRLKDADVRRVIRFLVSGGSAASVEYLSFFMIIRLAGSDSLVLPNALSFALGLLVSYLLNRRWVFRSKRSTGPQFIKYSSLAVTNLAISTILVATLASVVGINPFLAKLVAMALVATWNYFIFSKYLFND